MLRPLQILAIVSASMGAASALAQNITIANPGFELPAMSPGGFTTSPPEGWSGGSGAVGVFFPTMSSWGYTTTQGNQLAYTNGQSIQQTLTETVRAGVEYVLIVDIIHRPGFYRTYKVELLAGDTVVALDDGRLAPASGQSMASVVVFKARADDPLIGQPLTIRLSGPTQANFDDVRMTTCRADVDGDGLLTVFDFLSFQNFFAVGDLRADFQADGVLDFFDFLAFQNAFSGGCD